MYDHIFAPMQIGNVTLKSRILSSKCNGMHRSFEEDTAHYCNIARNGAATVIMTPVDYPSRVTEFLPDGRPARHGSGINMENEADRESYRKMVEAIHACGSLASQSMMDIEPGFVGIADVPDYDSIPRHGDYSQMLFEKPGISHDALEKLLDEFVFRCRDAQSLGADMASFYACYRASILATSLSPLYNYRTDEYGGSTMAERASLILELCRRVREACGPDFLIELQVSAEEEAPGYTLEEFLEFCRLIDGAVDILELRGYDGSATHVTGMNAGPHDLPNLRYAEAVKALHLKHTKVAPVGGFGDAADIDAWIAADRTDLVTMARRYISDFSYAEKLRENRAEDIYPCLLCNKCHAPQPTCCVNPKRGNPTAYPLPARSKRVAVVGGGAAGMRAAAIAASRGHDVTLFEAKDHLGGQLIAAGTPDFKWPVRRYCEWLQAQIEKHGVKVLLQTPATPENLRGFDAIFAATGSVPVRPEIPGAEKAVLAEAVFGHESEVGHRVVIVGGAETGRELAVHLAKLGRDVTMLTRGQLKKFGDNHAQRIEEETWDSLENLRGVDFAQTTEIGAHYVCARVGHNIQRLVQGFPASGLWGLGFNVSPDVPATMPPAHSSLDTVSGPFPRPVFPDLRHATYTDERFECDTVILSGGRKSVDAAWMRDLAPEFAVIGDATKPDDITRTAAEAYAAAMQL